MTGRGPALSAQLVIREGHWHPRYARVLLIHQFGDWGLAVVDGNGDGAELDIQYWTRTADGWQGGSSSGYGPLDVVRPAFSWIGWGPGVVFAQGSAAPGATIRLRWRGDDYETTANDYGLWCQAFDATAYGDAHAIAARDLEVLSSR